MLEEVLGDVLTEEIHAIGEEFGGGISVIFGGSWHRRESRGEDRHVGPTSSVSHYLVFTLTNTLTKKILRKTKQRPCANSLCH
jgi:hypothetical protein